MSLRLTSMLTKNIHQAISTKAYNIKRFLSGKASNKLTFVQSRIQKEQNYLLPYLYISQVTGNQISVRLCKAFNHWLDDIPKDKYEEIVDITKLVHSAVLLGDDFIDNTILRRKIPAAHVVFSAANTVVTSHLLHYMALEAAEHLGHPDAEKVVIQQVGYTYQGQAMEMHWTENGRIPNDEEYEESVQKKSSYYIRVSAKLLELFSKKKYDFNPVINAFIKYYQIRDDYNDIGAHNLKNVTGNAKLDDDISAGIYSYPILHALRTNPDDYQIRRILRMRTHDNNIKKHLISLLEQYGSLENTRVYVNELEQNIRDEIEKLGGNPAFTEIVDFLSTNGVKTK